MGKAFGFKHGGDVLNALIGLNLGAASIKAELAPVVSAEKDSRSLGVGCFSPAASPNGKEGVRLEAGPNSVDVIPKLPMAICERMVEEVREESRKPGLPIIRC